MWGLAEHYNWFEDSKNQIILRNYHKHPSGFGTIVIDGTVYPLRYTDVWDSQVKKIAFFTREQFGFPRFAPDGRSEMVYEVVLPNVFSCAFTVAIFGRHYEGIEFVGSVADASRFEPYDSQDNLESADRKIVLNYRFSIADGNIYHFDPPSGAAQGGSNPGKFYLYVDNTFEAELDDGSAKLAARGTWEKNGMFPTLRFAHDEIWGFAADAVVPLG